MQRLESKLYQVPCRLSGAGIPAFIALIALLFSTQCSNAQGQKVLKQHVPAATALIKPTGRLAADRKLHLAIGLPLRNQAALNALLRNLYDPASPQYRHFLTPREFTEQFGPTPADYQTVKNFAKAHNLHIKRTHPNRVVLDVEGSVDAIENAFAITLNVYQHPTEARAFFAPNADPRVDAALPVLHVSGLDDYSRPHPKYRVKRIANPATITANDGSAPGGAYWGSDFRNAYVPGTTLTGQGQSVGLLQFDGFYPTDVTTYEDQAGLPHIPLTVVPVDGGVDVPSDGNAEVCLDIEMVASMAPGVSRIYVYEAPNPSPWSDLLNQMANDNLAKQLSCSWGGGPPDPTCELIFQQMAAQGQTFFNATGDSDAFTGPIDFPSESTNIVQVGGTTLTTYANGVYASETVWNWGGDVGSSGGVSPTYPLPDYQQGISMTKNGGSTSSRNLPDVALTGDNVYVDYDNGSSDVFGGTSCAAPLWAAFTALVNEQATGNARPPVGFINPAIYAIGKSANYTSAFHDVTTGNNINSSSPGAYYAVPGYDLCTGWGTPNGSALIDALAGPPDVLQITPGSGFTANGAAGGPFDVTAQTLTLTNAGTNSLDWQLYNTADWLSVSATFGTLPSQGPAASVVVSLNDAASNLVAGTYVTSIWITNLSDGIGQNRTYTLNVLGAPVFTLQPSSRTANQGDTVNFSGAVIGLSPITYQWTFNGANIGGATDTTLTLNSVSTNDSGSYTLVASNSLGTTTSSPAVLTVFGTPDNDQCAGAFVISGNDYTNTQSTALATSDNDPFPSCVTDFGNGVWYTWTATTDGYVSVDTIGSDFDTVLVGYSGTCDSLTEVGCDDDSGDALTSQLIHAVTAGTTYYYLAGGYASDAGQLILHLNVIQPVTFVTQPVSIAVPTNTAASFSVTVTGASPPFTYQWYSTTDNGVTGTILHGRTNSSFTIQHATAALAHGYYVVVTDSFTPPISATSQVAALNIYTPPHFKTQPASQTKVAGNNAVFRASATGSGPFTYQWRLNGTPIDGATNTVYTRFDVQAPDAGTYQCIVAGAYGVTASTSSAKGILTVTPDTDFPQVYILHPLAGASFTNGLAVNGQTNIAPQLNISGKALDHGLITNVCLIRTFPTSAQFTNVVTLSGSAPGTKMWTNQVTLVPGQNTFIAQATDSAGHKTTSAPRNFNLKTH